jgi:hypothetical protein
LATYAHLQVDPLLNICVFGESVVPQQAASCDALSKLSHQISSRLAEPGYLKKSVSFCKVNDAVAITLFRVLNEGWKHFKLPELPELRVAPGILPGGIFQDTSFHIISSRHQVAFHTLSS